MTNTNKITASFNSRAEAMAYCNGVRMLSDLYPAIDIRVSGPWEAEIEGCRWRVYVHRVGA